MVPYLLLVPSFTCIFLQQFGIDILHSHDRLTKPLSLESNRVCYHKWEYEIPPYHHPNCEFELQFI